ncbi:MAG: 4'-phosphopantetheinyl transferase superfamily protein, partial [Candidatus Omnitrophica bacterium]|nr:4'-phosphopantetheinyl transferase superfamily protein [Candidatus Omnitrophota bacterium]
MAGLGIDAVEIERIKEAVDRHGEKFLRKILTDREARYASSKTFGAMH